MYLLAYGAALLLVVIALPDGLAGAAARLIARAWPAPPAPLAGAARHRVGAARDR